METTADFERAYSWRFCDGMSVGSSVVRPVASRLIPGCAGLLRSG